jgi:predicted DNA-binding transcriptional regulator YafY
LNIIIEGVSLFEIQSKIKRQIEILGLCLSGSSDRKTTDLAVFFNVEELTIKRDLQELRSYGIDIHSTRKNGICLAVPLDNSKHVESILHYIGLNHTTLSIDKSTFLLVEKFGCKALSSIVLLQLCIDNSRIAVIDYNQETGLIEKNKKIEPLLIFQNDGTWRLLVQSGEIIKQYLLDKIMNVKMTEERFTKLLGERFEDLFMFSWKSWLGDEKYDIKLQIAKDWADRIRPRMLIKGQQVTKQEDDSIIFEATVNSLNEIAGWIVSRGEGIKVLAPDKLKEHVIELAQGVLKNY